MNEGITLTKLATVLERRAATMEDYIADTRRLGLFIEETEDKEEPRQQIRTRSGRVRRGARFVVSQPNHAFLTIDGEDGEFQLTDFAQGQIATHWNVPHRFWDRLRDDHPDLLQTTMTALMSREPSTRMVRTLDGKARAFLSNSYRRLDHLDLMKRAVLPAIKTSKLEVVSANVTDTRLYVKVLFPEIEHRVTRKKGDIVRGGIVISNSEVGAGAVSVEPLLYQLICTNGMIAPVHYADFGLRKYHVGRRIEDTEAARALFSERTLALDDEAFYAQVKDVVSGAATGIAFAKIVARMKELSGLRVTPNPDVPAVVQKLAKTANLTELEGKGVLTRLIEGGDLSALGYVNAVTNMAGVVEDYDRSTEMERIGGSMLEWSDRAWAELLATEGKED